MKNIFSLLFAILFSSTVMAQMPADGYYRVRNVGSTRYLTVKDNKGSIDVSSTSADLGAVELYKKFTSVVSDPGSVLYIDNVNSTNYKFIAQGTDTYKIIGYYLKLKRNSDGSYKAYQEKSMMVMYLCDAEKGTFNKGALGTNDKGTNYRDWKFLPMDVNGENYFGLTPEVTSGSDYYASFYASFPFTTVSAGMKVYYICKVDGNKAVYKEVEGNVVPGGMPIFVKCSSVDATDNRVDIAANSAKLPTDNQLGGVYFCNTTNAHKNVTPYNAQTMRILGVTSTGELGYVKTNITNLPANKSYLKVPAGAPDELTLISYDDYITAIDEVGNDEVDYSAVYNLRGIKVATSEEEYNALPSGIYIINGVKVRK